MPRTRHYDRKGNPIDLMTWAKLFEDDQYRIVAHSMLAQSGATISTVWMGLDRLEYERITKKMKAPVAIFETRVSDADGRCLAEYTYATEQEAKDGHLHVVSRLSMQWAAARTLAKSAWL